MILPGLFETHHNEEFITILKHFNEDIIYKNTVVEYLRLYLFLNLFRICFIQTLSSAYEDARLEREIRIITCG